MKKILSDFGQNFIENVRDNSLFVFEGIISGHMKNMESKKLHEQLVNFSPNELDVLRKIAYKMVDLTLHNTLFLFEQDIDGWKISNPEHNIEDLSSISDGLSGELYTIDGWIKKYSHYDASVI